MQGLAVAVALIVINIITVFLTVGKVWWFAPLASNWGSLDTLIIISFVVSGIVFVVVNLFMAYSVYYHRTHPGRKAFFFEDSPKLEWSLIGITTVGIVGLLAPGLYYYGVLISMPKESHIVEVLTQQWLWSYRYPGADGKFGASNILNYTPDNPFGLDKNDPAGQDDIVAIGQPLKLPVNKPVVLHLRSNDVLHAFYVPEFRNKQDIVPGMVTKMWFTPTKTGNYQTICTEYCGMGHYAMVGQVEVVEASAYQEYLDQAPKAAQILGFTKTAQR
jgi:cytochrome c oxidase subunit 2